MITSISTPLRTKTETSDYWDSIKPGLGYEFQDLDNVIKSGDTGKLDKLIDYYQSQMRPLSTQGKTAAQIDTDKEINRGYSLLIQNATDGKTYIANKPKSELAPAPTGYHYDENGNLVPIPGYEPAQTGTDATEESFRTMLRDKYGLSNDEISNIVFDEDYQKYPGLMRKQVIGLLDAKQQAKEQESTRRSQLEQYLGGRISGLETEGKTLQDLINQITQKEIGAATGKTGAERGYFDWYKGALGQQKEIESRKLAELLGEKGLGESTIATGEQRQLSTSVLNKLAELGTELSQREAQRLSDIISRSGERQLGVQQYLTGEKSRLQDIAGTRGFQLSDLLAGQLAGIGAEGRGLTQDQITKAWNEALTNAGWQQQSTEAEKGRTFESKYRLTPEEEYKQQLEFWNITQKPYQITPEQQQANAKEIAEMYKPTPLDYLLEIGKTGAEIGADIYTGGGYGAAKTGVKTLGNLLSPQPSRSYGATYGYDEHGRPKFVKGGY